MQNKPVKVEHVQMNQFWAAVRYFPAQNHTWKHTKLLASRKVLQGKNWNFQWNQWEKKNRESETGLSNTKFIKLLVFCCLIKCLPVSQEIRWFWPWNSDSLPKVTLEFFKNLSLNLRYILHKSIHLLVSEYLSWRDRKKDTGPDGWAWKHCGDKPNTIGKFNRFSWLPNENFGP